MSVRSGAKTGRSPGDKRIVKEPSSDANIWWGDVNMPISEHTFAINRERAIDYLNVCPVIYVVDAFAGWDPELRIKVRIVCTRAYHALFMTNMLIVPSADELATFGEPDVTIYNAGAFPANRFTEGMTSAASVALHFGKLELVILGTEYAGEMKKGVFTVMNYLMPLRGVLSMHSSCNVSKTDPSSVTLFFGLSGTGKTTLSADPHRELIGDDEHLWSDRGISNIEGGCYAKVDNLSATDEPEIHGAIRYGCVVENVVLDPQSREIDFHDLSLTSNTRASYPLGHIPSARIPALSTHPNNVVLLTADAFGVLPPVSKLTPEQVSYLFIVGYTSKIPGTEVGVTEPVATFSPCFGGPFIPLAPANTRKCWPRGSRPTARTHGFSTRAGPVAALAPASARRSSLPAPFSMRSTMAPSPRARPPRWTSLASVCRPSARVSPTTCFSRARPGPTRTSTTRRFANSRKSSTRPLPRTPTRRATGSGRQDPRSDSSTTTTTMIDGGPAPRSHLQV
jgi:phosphoenolpyruvate carboxykinase (ATP)